jgi:hypothetical protein
MDQLTTDRRRVISSWVLLAGCVLASFLVYGELILLPFLRDDLRMIARIDQAGPSSAWQMIIPDFTHHVLFFRPMGSAYFLLVHSLFGDNPLPYHVLALVWHGINAYLVASIVRKLMPMSPVYWLAAALYLGAAAIHADPLTWVVGIYDIGAMLFTLLAVRMMLEGWHWTASASYLIAMLFKESAAPVGIAAAVCVCCSSKQYRLVAPYLIALVAYAGVHMAILDPSKLGAGHPYHLVFTVGHASREWGIFGNWIYEGFFPYPWQGLFSLPVLIVGIQQVVRGKPSPRRNAAIMLLIAMLLAGIVPILLIQFGQAVRYYVDFAFVPVCIGVVLLVGRMPARLDWVTSIAWALVTLVCAHYLIDDAHNHLPTLLNGNTSNYAVP